jgi:hypothetical protein
MQEVLELRDHIFIADSSCLPLPYEACQIGFQTLRLFKLDPKSD